jgi:hypothetical protein
MRGKRSSSSSTLWNNEELEPGICPNLQIHQNNDIVGGLVCFFARAARTRQSAHLFTRLIN